MQAYTLDSNILIYHLKGETKVPERIESWLLGGDRLFISAITRIELLAAPAMTLNDERLILALLVQFTLVPVEAQVADLAAKIRRAHRVELGDSIIAATALLVNTPLVTRNTRDFKKIKGLSLFAL